MTSIFYALIVLPLIFLIIIAFVFASNLREVKLQQFVLMCPFPIANGDVTNVTLPETASGWVLSYIIVTGNATFNQDGKYFDCHIDRLASPDAPSVSIINKEYGAAVGNCSTFCIPYGQAAFFADNVVLFFSKITPLFTLLVTVFNAPAIITGIGWYSFVNIVLIAFIGLGVVMVVRG